MRRTPKIIVNKTNTPSPFYCVSCKKTEPKRSGVHIVCRLCGKVLAEEVRRR